MIKQELLNVLNTFGFPVILHGSLGADEPFPYDFFTFQIIDSPSTAIFDNTPTKTAYNVQVNFYSASPVNVESYANQARTALKAAGFIPQGKGRDIPSDEPTHTGWTCDYYYLADY